MPSSRGPGPKRGPGGIYKHLDVRQPVQIASLAAPVKPKELTPRQRAIAERDEEIKKALNQAAAGPESVAIPIKVRPDQKLATLRAAVLRVIKATGSPVNLALRGDTLYLSRGTVPGRGGRRVARTPKR